MVHLCLHPRMDVGLFLNLIGFTSMHSGALTQNKFFKYPGDMYSLTKNTRSGCSSVCRTFDELLYLSHSIVFLFLDAVSLRRERRVSCRPVARKLGRAKLDGDGAGGASKDLRTNNNNTCFPGLFIVLKLL